MTDETSARRRDPRYTLRADRAFAEFEDPRDGVTCWAGRLVTLSVAGLSIVVDARFPIEPGTLLEGVTLRVGECRLHGDVAVKNTRCVDSVSMAIGGLFYPDTEDGARLLMALIAGMEAVDLEPADFHSRIALEALGPVTGEEPGTSSRNSA